MSRLINDLLAYSRVSKGGCPIELVDTEEILHEILTNLHVRISESSATITHDPLPAVWADKTQLGQLFQNLLGNALKFRSELPPQIHIGVTYDNGYVRFSMQDNGIGIEPKYADRIFTVFQRLHTMADYEGTGIGLAICKKIVEQHNGQIWFESKHNEGTTFYFTLPNEKEKSYER